MSNNPPIMVECRFDCPNINKCPKLSGKCPAFEGDSKESALAWCNEVVSRIADTDVDAMGKNPLYNFYEGMVGRHTKPVLVNKHRDSDPWD